MIFSQSCFPGRAFAIWIERKGASDRICWVLLNIFYRTRGHSSALKNGAEVLLPFLSMKPAWRLAKEKNLRDSHAFSPAASFDRQWALTVLDRALATVENECDTGKRMEEFRLLSPWLTGEAEHGDQTALAESLGVPTNTLKSMIHRLRRQFRQAVKEEVGQTLLRTEDLENEMTALFDALSS